MRKEVVANTEAILEMAKDALRLFGSVMPFFLFLTLSDDGQVEADLVLHDEDGRSPMEDTEQIERVARKMGAIGLIFVGETWYIDANTKNKEDVLSGKIQIRDHPDRKEAILMSIYDDRGNLETHQIPFKRVGERKIEFEDPVVMTNQDPNAEVKAKLDPWRDVREQGGISA